MGPRLPEHTMSFSDIGCPFEAEEKSPFKMSNKELAEEIGSWPGYLRAAENQKWIFAQQQAKWDAAEGLIEAVKLLLKEGKTEVAVRFAEATLASALPPYLYK